MTPVDPGYEVKVRESFARQSHMATLGAAILARHAGGGGYLAAVRRVLLPAEQASCHRGCPRQRRGFRQRICRLHAGAARHPDVLAVEFKINLLAPARAPTFLARGRVLRAGRTLTVCQADVSTAGSDEPALIAVMLSTLILRAVQPAGTSAKDPPMLQDA